VTRLAILVLLGAALLLASCGGDDKSPTSAATATAPSAPTATQPAKTPSTAPGSGPVGGIADTNHECSLVAAKAKIPDGEVFKQAYVAAPFEQGMTNVVSLGAKSNPRLKELATAHALLAQLYAGAGTSPGQAKTLTRAITRLEPRIARMAAAAGVPRCALKPVFAR
jgi:hypothetical protein